MTLTAAKEAAEAEAAQLKADLAEQVSSLTGRLTHADSMNTRYLEEIGSFGVCFCIHSWFLGGERVASDAVECSWHTNYRPRRYSFHPCHAPRCPPANPA